MAVVLMAGGSEAMAENAAGRFDRPWQGFAPASTMLRADSAESAGLDPGPLAEAERAIEAWTRPNPTRPLFAGAVTLSAHNGVIVSRSEAGQAVRYADASGTELPAEQRVPMRPDTIFDLASVSKLFTSLAVLCLVEDGSVDVDAPVAGYLPEFAANGKDSVTVKQLLTHTSGLEPFIPLWRDWPDKASRIAAVLDRAPKYLPGSRYVYSDLNLITLGVLVERRSGKPLDTLVAERITGPLGLRDTGYNPSAAKLHRVAATEFQSSPPRGMVRGEAHDENAWSLGGVAGHAGVFSTADDLAVLAQAILNGGGYAGRRILRAETVREMLTNHTPQFPGNDHGLGFELNQRWYMGALSGQRTAGHTGFTGTSLVIDPASRSFTILLTNRVHPSRTWGSINLARERLASGLARAMAVCPRHGADAWATGWADGTTSTLTSPQLVATGSAQVTFDTFVDTESSDVLRLEWSSDGQTWQALPMRAAGRGAPPGQVDVLAGAGHRSWWTINADVPAAGQFTVRWRASTDGRYLGRGFYVDRILVTDGDRPLLNGEKEPHLMTPDGWRPQSC
ncbi:serine hydrolase [Actinokineospora sp. HBU206404]|uniref:Serine hydrolase n=2 Tax=Actinokineospora xionganensis TaxID=2684470 RepID=A0ABR7L2S6_9PSEU|nr:serine hydrolase [Actinokineospora xionganensis]MBC6447002.1 serine hydrolase [Actinokineospora xionganensis]